MKKEQRNNMEVKTKYNVGDEVWYEYGGQIKKTPIFKIIATDYDNITNIKTIEFFMSDYTSSPAFDENQLFDTKEEAAKAWLKSQHINLN